MAASKKLKDRMAVQSNMQVNLNRFFRTGAAAQVAPHSASAAASASVTSASASSSTSSSVSLTALLSSTSSSPWSRQDVREYLSHYPGQSDVRSASKNVAFYTGRIASQPRPGATIDQIHAKWKGDYQLLEQHHGYIQWIFPIRENGLNQLAQRLMLHEIETLRSDPAVRARLLRSYEMMLDFYGMGLVDARTGEVARNTSNYAARYRHLNASTHNYLRITRILKCLGELGLESLKLGFLLHALRELKCGALKVASVGKSARDYWFPLLRDASDRAILASFTQSILQHEASGATDLSVVSANAIKCALAQAAQKRAEAAAAADDAPQAAEAAQAEQATQAGNSAAESGAAPSSAVSSDADDASVASVDSPRAVAESLFPSRASSAASLACAPGPGEASAASAAPATAFSLAAGGKRKLQLDPTASSVSTMDGPSSKRAATPTAAATAQEAEMDK